MDSEKVDTKELILAIYHLFHRQYFASYAIDMFSATSEYKNKIINGYDIYKLCQQWKEENS